MKDNNPLLVEERYYPWEPRTFAPPKGSNSPFYAVGYDVQDSFKEKIRRMICAEKLCFYEKKCAHCL